MAECMPRNQNKTNVLIYLRFGTIAHPKNNATCFPERRGEPIQFFARGNCLERRISTPVCVNSLAGLKGASHGPEFSKRYAVFQKMLQNLMLVLVIILHRDVM